MTGTVQIPSDAYIRAFQALNRAMRGPTGTLAERIECTRARLALLQMCPFDPRATCLWIHTMAYTLATDRRASHSDTAQVIADTAEEAAKVAKELEAELKEMESENLEQARNPRRSTAATGAQ